MSIKTAHRGRQSLGWTPCGSAYILSTNTWKPFEVGLGEHRASFEDVSMEMFLFLFQSLLIVECFILQDRMHRRSPTSFLQCIYHMMLQWENGDHITGPIECTLTEVYLISQDNFVHQGSCTLLNHMKELRQILAPILKKVVWTEENDEHNIKNRDVAVFHMSFYSCNYMLEGPIYMLKNHL